MTAVYQEAISVDILCSCTIGISVLGESFLPLIDFWESLWSWGVYLIFFSPFKVKYFSSWNFVDQNGLILWQSSWHPQRFQRFLLSAVTGVKFATLSSHFNKRCLNKMSSVDLWGMSNSRSNQELGLKQIRSFGIYALVCALKQSHLILSVSFLAFFWMKLNWERCSRNRFRCKLSFSPRGQARVSPKLKKQTWLPLEWV